MRAQPHFITHRHGKSTGFSLVELLVVIAIIAVLGALTTVGVRGMMAKAHESNCQGNLRQLGVAIQSFVAEKGRYPTPSLDPATWDRMILPYIADSEFDYTLGKFNPIRDGTAEGAALGSAVKILKCPADDVKAPAGQFKRSYSMCNWTENQREGVAGGWNNGFPQLSPGQGVPPALVSEPHRAVMMTEFWGPKDSQFKNVIGSNAYAVMFGFVGQPQDAGPFNFHKSNINVLFADGHVESIPGNLSDTEWYERGYSPPKAPKVP
jgi:prepilin-type N-terminal cleavage/methylation domain-containing protein/prepilin-type processing-associated H-X9-DG protein